MQVRKDWLLAGLLVLSFGFCPVAVDAGLFLSQDNKEMRPREEGSWVALLC